MLLSRKSILLTSLAVVASLALSACGQGPKALRAKKIGGARPGAGTEITADANNIILKAPGYTILNSSTQMVNGNLNQTIKIMVEGVTMDAIDLTVSVAGTSANGADGEQLLDVKMGNTAELMTANQMLLSGQNLQVYTIARCADASTAVATTCNQMYSTTYVMALNQDGSLNSIFQYGSFFDGEQSYLVTKTVNQTVSFDEMIAELSTFNIQM